MYICMHIYVGVYVYIYIYVYVVIIRSALILRERGGWFGGGFQGFLGLFFSFSLYSHWYS